MEHGRKDRGMAAAAKSLGVSRATLWRALKGKTENPELVSRYRAIISMQVTNQTPK